MLLQFPDAALRDYALRPDPAVGHTAVVHAPALFQSSCSPANQVRAFAAERYTSMHPCGGQGIRLFQQVFTALL